MDESTAPPPDAPRAAGGFPLKLVLLCLFGVMALGLVFVTPVLMRMLQPNVDQQSLTQARRIYNACQAFSAIRGKLPNTLEELVPDFLPDRRALGDPVHPEAGDIGYYYYASGSNAAESADSVFLASKASRDDHRVVVRFDGRTRLQYFPESWLPR